MEVGSFTIIATPYSIIPYVFARRIIELAVIKGVIFIGRFIEEVKNATIPESPICRVTEYLLIQFQILIFELI
jgi:hypothetical protein